MCTLCNPTNFENRDRRDHQRFPWRLRVEYELAASGIAISGEGTTINFSSGGVQFTTTGCEIPIGGEIVCSIDWPVDLSDGCALKLVARGLVVWSARDKAAIKIRSHEFRTRARSNRTPLNKCLWGDRGFENLPARGRAYSGVGDSGAKK